jgi:transmembrane sensor
MTSSDQQVRAECREWLTLLHSGEASDADRDRFDTWLHADPRHERAYAKLQRLWSELGELHQLSDLEPVPAARTPRTRALRVRAWPWAAAASVAALAVLALLPRVQTQAPSSAVADARFSQDYATGIGEVRALQLPDGSTLTLGAHSRASVRITDTQRRVRLQQGEGYFDVAKDADRPFYVDAQQAAVRVVGTRFEVRVGAQSVRVAVAEGRVAVNDRDHPLVGGERIDVLADGKLTAVEPVADGEIGVWRDGRLVYEDSSLAEVVADLARYRGDVVLRSPEAGVLRVTAGLRVDQAAQFVEGLPHILPVQVTHENGALVIDRRP